MALKFLTFTGLIVIVIAAPLVRPAKPLTVALPSAFHQPEYVLNPNISGKGCPPGWASDGHGYCGNPCTGKVKWVGFSRFNDKEERSLTTIETASSGKVYEFDFNTLLPRQQAAKTLMKTDGSPENQKEAAGKPINAQEPDEQFLRDSKKTLQIHGTAEERENARPIGESPPPVEVRHLMEESS